MRLLPPLRGIKTTRSEKVELVNHTAVEEVLLDIGMLDFGKGVRGQGQRGGLAHARRREAAGGRVRLSVQVRARGRAARRGDEAGRAALHPAAGGGAATGSPSEPPRPAPSTASKATRPPPTNRRRAVCRWARSADESRPTSRACTSRLNVFVATSLLWLVIRKWAGLNPIWAISAMLAVERSARERGAQERPRSRHQRRCSDAPPASRS